MPRYAGLDVHKDSVVVAIAKESGGDAVSYGQIPCTREAVGKLASKLTRNGDTVKFCYEARPCGYGLYRQMGELGYECMMVAPSLIPRKRGERIKTDRRDARSLARQYRSGDLTAVWVPGEEQEAMRDLTRPLEDMKRAERRMKQQLS